MQKYRDRLIQLKKVNGTMKTKQQQHIATNELGDLLDNQIESITEKIRLVNHLNKCQSCREAYQLLKLLNEEWSIYEAHNKKLRLSNFTIGLSDASS